MESVPNISLKDLESRPDEAYSHMAAHYDFLLGHVDYEHWYNYIKMIMHVYFGFPEHILEIGTGTGKFGSYFSRDGYPITGLDLSFEMLRAAKLRAYKNYSIVCGDARNLPFSKPFDFIFSVHDTLNYITEIEDLKKVLLSAASLMHEDSVFLFDMTTEYNVLTNFDSQVKSFQHNDWMIQWYNEYDKGKRIIESFMTFRKDDEFKQEIHRQKIYTTEEVLILLKECGLTLFELYADYTYEKPGPKTIMKNFVLKRKTNRK